MVRPTGIDSEKGVYWTLDVNGNNSTQCVNFITRVGTDNSKPLGDYDAKVDFAQLGIDNSVYTRQGVAKVYKQLSASVGFFHRSERHFR